MYHMTQLMKALLTCISMTQWQRVRETWSPVHCLSIEVHVGLRLRNGHMHLWVFRWSRSQAFHTYKELHLCWSKRDT